MPQAYKVERVKELQDQIKDKELIFFDYEGINVEDLTAIRSSLREKNGLVKVSKNTFMKMALKNNDIEPDEEVFKQMTALAIIEGEFSDSGKVLSDAEKEEKLKIKGGYYDGKVVDASFVKKLANIPSLDVLYSMLVGCLQGPTSNLVFILEAIAKKKQEEGEA